MYEEPDLERLTEIGVPLLEPEELMCISLSLYALKGDKHCPFGPKTMGLLEKKLSSWAIAFWGAKRMAEVHERVGTVLAERLGKTLEEVMDGPIDCSDIDCSDFD